jgi:hypothetical protein
MWEAIKRILSQYGWGQREPLFQWTVTEPVYMWHTGGPGVDSAQAWHDAGFFTAHKAKTERLAAIAAEISALNVKRLKAKEQKKNQTVFEDQMKALMNERLRIEGGK